MSTERKKTHTHKEKPSKMAKQNCKHDIAINMPKDDWWSIKQKGIKARQEFMG